MARRGIMTTAHVEGNAEIQTEMKLAVWIYKTLVRGFRVLESDGIGAQEHVESCRVEAQSGAHCGAVGRNGVVRSETEPVAWFQVGIETAFGLGIRPIETGRTEKACREPLVERHHIFSTEIQCHCKHLELAGILGCPVEFRKVLEIIAESLELL